MPAPKMPTPPPSASPVRFAEVLDELLANRPGWESTDHGWEHKKTKLHVCAQGSRFILARPGTTDTWFTTRVGLELHLAGAGA